ncbi:MAG: tRNA preQ1(34) S-adenosylmethionine ribosyltransferase-isomerase QueA [Sphingomonadales bacterium]
MRVDLFDFDLPEDRIALAPAEPRDAARLLRVCPAMPPRDYGVRDLPRLLRAGDVMVFNDTKVIPARLVGRRGQARIELNLHKAIDGQHWQAFVKGARRLKLGDCIVFAEDFSASVLAKAETGEVSLAFTTPADGLMAALARHGSMPLPPYIASRRGVGADDAQSYQTVYGRRAGAVAAPTAGLHFTPGLLQALADAGIGQAMLTLHVGAGTFLPVKADDTRDHLMHAEWGQLDAATASRLNAAREAGGRIVAVGTTALRLLESAADADGRILPFEGETDIFITPGYRFRAVDMLMTNFHLPRSTLFMLVSAFSGLETMKTAYAHAVAANYRFYSYGDACLLSPADARP